MGQLYIYLYIYIVNPPAYFGVGRSVEKSFVDLRLPPSVIFVLAAKVLLFKSKINCLG